MEWLGRLDITDLSIYLRPRYVFWMLLGIPLFLPSYRIPLGSIREVHDRPPDPPSGLFRILGKPSGATLEVVTDSGSRCLLEFASLSEATAARAALTKV
jgi:hypothetical protein